EDLLAFFDARLNRLAPVVLPKPERQIERSWAIAIVQQCARPLPLRQLLAHQQRVERIASLANLLRSDRERFGISSHPRPDRLGFQASQQTRRGLATVRLGQDRITHLNQPAQVLIAAEAGVQPQHYRQLRSWPRVVLAECHKPAAQAANLLTQLAALAFQPVDTPSQASNRLLAAFAGLPASQWGAQA